MNSPLTLVKGNRLPDPCEISLMLVCTTPFLLFTCCLLFLVCYFVKIHKKNMLCLESKCMHSFCDDVTCERGYRLNSGSVFGGGSKMAAPSPPPVCESGVKE